MSFDLDAAGRCLVDDLVAEYEQIVQAPLADHLRPLCDDEMGRLSEIAEVLYHGTVRANDLSARLERILDDVLELLPESPSAG